MESNQPTDLGAPHPETNQASDQPPASQQRGDLSTPAGVARGTDPPGMATGATEKPWSDLSTDDKMDRLMKLIASGFPVVTPAPAPGNVAPAVQATVAPLAAGPGNPATVAAGPQAIPAGARFDPFTGEPIATSTTAGGGIHPAAAAVDALAGWDEMEQDERLDLLAQQVRFLIERLRVP